MSVKKMVRDYANGSEKDRAAALNGTENMQRNDRRQKKGNGKKNNEEFDWKDSNFQFVGSKEDKFKKTVADCEPAWQGTEELQTKNDGLKIWRIEKFKVKDWPERKYGSFFNGDSYIILHTEKAPDSDEIWYDIHFWIGKQSTQDEYGTACDKTVELDTYLDDKAVQHREVAGKECEEFKEYFTNFRGINVDEGGIDSGVKNVEELKTIKSEETLVIHFKQGKETVMPYMKSNLRCDKGFLVIFSGEYRIFQLKGSKAPLNSTVPFNKWLSKKKEEYLKATLVIFETLAELKKNNIYCKAKEDFQTKLVRFGKTLSFEVVATNEDIDKSFLSSDGVFLLETEEGLVVWIGERASTVEKKNGFAYAHNYLKDCGQDPTCSISCMRENVGRCPRVWEKFMANSEADQRM